MSTSSSPAVFGNIPSPTQQGEVASADKTSQAIFVSPTRDLAAKPGSNQDSWFLTSHLNSSRGVLDLLIHYLHAVPPTGGPGVLMVMVSLLESKTDRYISEEQDFPADQCKLDSDRCNVISPIASCRGDASSLNFKGTWTTANISCDITVSQAGPMLANMGTGLWPTLGGLTYHYALPTMTTIGNVTIDGEVVEVSGPSWLDRQWGVTPRFFEQSPKKWVWFSLVLDNGIRISVWEMLENKRIPRRFATILHANGLHEIVDVEPLTDNATRPWKSSKTGRTYPTVWDLKMPMVNGRITIKPKVLEQEFVSPTGAHKYEGAAPVSGTLGREVVNGYAVIELVGDWL